MAKMTAIESEPGSRNKQMYSNKLELCSTTGYVIRLKNKTLKYANGPGGVSKLK